MYLTAIASSIPASSIDNIDQSKAFGKPVDFIQSKIGALSLPRKLLGETSADLSERAVDKLLHKIPLSKDDIDLICVVTQNPAEGGIPHTSALVHARGGFPPSCSTFDISLGCSGFVYGLSIVSSFLAANNLSHAILVTCDPYSDIIDPADPNTSLLFGDAAAASLVSRDVADCCFKIGRLYGYSDGKSGAAIQKTSTGRLEMNGRAVFNFALKQVPLQIKACLQSENLSFDEVDAFLLHQGSYAIIDAIARSFSGFEKKFVKDLADTGNTVSSSIPLLLEKMLDSVDCLPKTILMSGFGVGLSAATMILTSAEAERA